MWKLFLKDFKTTEDKILLFATFSLGVMTFLVLGIGITLILLNLNQAIEIFNLSKTGQLGDSFNGILGPFIALTASVLTFSAFYVQYRANEQQKVDIKLSKFKEQFFELLKINRENVAEMKITSPVSGEQISGREVFEFMNADFKRLYIIVQSNYDITSKLSNSTPEPLTREFNVICITYLLLMLGTKDKLSANYRIEEILKNQSAVSTPTFIAKLMSYYSTIGNSTPVYHFLMGHYYRNLYLLIKFIDKNDLLSIKEKYEYAEIVKSQLSTVEQAALFYHSLSTFSEAWEFERVGHSKRFDLITKYNLIQNIPPDYCLPIYIRNFYGLVNFVYLNQFERDHIAEMRANAGYLND